MQWSIFCPYLTWCLSNTGHCWLFRLLQRVSPLAFCDSSLSLVFLSFSSLLLGLLRSFLFLSLGFSYLYSLLRWASLTFRLQKPLLAYSWKMHVFSPDLALSRASYILAVSTWMVGGELPSAPPYLCSALLHPDETCVSCITWPPALGGTHIDQRGKEEEGRVCIPRPDLWRVSRLLAGDLLQTALSDKVRNY